MAAAIGLGLMVYLTSWGINDRRPDPGRWAHCTGGVLIGCTREDVCKPFGCRGE